MKFTASLAMISLAALTQACTAGGVAVQGQGFLIPVGGASVKVEHCGNGTGWKVFHTQTNSEGTYFFQGQNSDGTIDPDTYVPEGRIRVTVNEGPNEKRYIYTHKHDTICVNYFGTFTCSKNLHMLTYSYDELSGNAPEPDVHVRFPLDLSDPHDSKVNLLFNLSCW